MVECCSVLLAVITPFVTNSAIILFSFEIILFLSARRKRSKSCEGSKRDAIHLYTASVTAVIGTDMAEVSTLLSDLATTEEAMKLKYYLVAQKLLNFSYSYFFLTSTYDFPA